MSAVPDAWVVADPTICCVCGRDSCEDHLPPDSQRDQSPHLTFQPASVVINAPRPVAVVEGLAWAGCVTVVVSESGAGKTFVTFDMGAAVSAGLPWHGRRTREGSVAYLSYEGDALGLRLRALRDVRGQRLEHVYILRVNDPLSPKVTRDGEERSLGELRVIQALTTLAADLRKSGKPPVVLVIIDTVRASMVGSEDSSEHVSAYLRAVRRVLACVPSAAIMLTHHAGWQDGDTQRKRERGSSAWRGNCDATLYLEAGEYDSDSGTAPLTLRTLKVRDNERPAPLHLVRRRVELNEIGDNGEPVTSCVIESDRRSHEDRQAEATAALEAEHRSIDLRLLRTITERPDMATSQDRLRLLMGIRKVAVADSLSRLLRSGWVEPAARNQPYRVTRIGASALEAS
jgi:hypothetical protein